MSFQPNNTGTLHSIVSSEINVLTSLYEALERETTALSTMDYGSIDKVREEKENYEQQLLALKAQRNTADGSLDQTIKNRYGELVKKIRKRGSHNNRRLEVCAATISGLIGKLTGVDQKPAYGRKRYGKVSTSVNPVLTSSVG